MTSDDERPVLLVVFGAGASNDSLPPPPGKKVRVLAADMVPLGRPPLASQLFNLGVSGYAQIAEQFPQAIRLMSDANEMALEGGAIEEQLETWQVEAERNRRRFAQLAAIRFYLQELLWESSLQWIAGANRRTNYLLLADRLEDWRQERNAEIAYVTFNYDLLLEDALPHLRLPTIRTSDAESMRTEVYVADEDTRVFKVHGSVNWGHPIQETHDLPDIDEPELRATIATRAPDLAIARDIKIQNDPLVPVIGEHLAFPAIAIPVVTKRAFEVPDAHLANLIRSLSRVRWMLVIGWRGAEENFKDILDDHLPELDRPLRIHVVGRDSQRTQLVTESLVTRLSRDGKRAFTQSVSGGGFTEYVGRADMLEILTAGG